MLKPAGLRYCDRAVVFRPFILAAVENADGKLAAVGPIRSKRWQLPLRAWAAQLVHFHGAVPQFRIAERGEFWRTREKSECGQEDIVGKRVKF
jgi:hypothetical protein